MKPVENRVCVYVCVNSSNYRNAARKGLRYMGGRKNRGSDSHIFRIFRTKATKANCHKNLSFKIVFLCLCVCVAHTHKVPPCVTISEDHLITWKGVYYSVNSDRKVPHGRVAES